MRRPLLTTALLAFVVLAVAWVPDTRAGCAPFFNLGAAYGETVSVSEYSAADYHPTINGSISAGAECGPARLSINHVSSLETRRDYGANFAAIEINLWRLIE